MVKLSVGSCACTKTGRVYCHTRDGYRFKKRTCSRSQRGKRIKKR